MIVVTLEGGLIQGISSDDPAEQGKQIVVIDYDSEGADPKEVAKVPQGKGETTNAIISTQEIGRLYTPVATFLKARQG